MKPKKEKGGDMWERSFGVPPAPSAEEKLSRSRLYRAGSRLDSMEDRGKRSRLYLALTAASIAVAVAVVAGAALVSSAAQEQYREAAAESPAAPEDGAARGDGSAGDAEGAARDPSARFSGASDVAWLSQAELSGLETGLSAYIDGLGYAAGARARLYGYKERADGGVVYATVDLDAQCIRCERAGSGWSYSRCDVPSGLSDYVSGKAAAREEAAAEKRPSAKQGSEKTIKASDAEALSALLPSDAAAELGPDFASYMELKKLPLDPSTIVVRESTAKVNAAGNTVVEVGAKAQNGDVVTAEAEWDKGSGTFSFSLS